MNEGWVQLRHVRKVFTTGEETLEVLKDITVSVSPGTVLVITGQSGCGKSTLLHLIGGLEGVTAGEICVGDVVVSSLKERELTLYRRMVLGFVFQLHFH
mgnify:FL=1